MEKISYCSYTSAANYFLFDHVEFVLAMVKKPIFNIQHSNFIITRWADEMPRTLHRYNVNVLKVSCEFKFICNRLGHNTASRSIEEAKGQLILKCPFGVFKLTKKTLKFGFLP